METDLKKLQKESLEHYDRMIAWADGRETNISYGHMKDNLGEAWSGVDCAYCNAFTSGWLLPNCRDCPLGSIGGCCNGKWVTMQNTKSWPDWVKAAKKVRAYIAKHGLGD